MNLPLPKQPWDEAVQEAIQTAVFAELQKLRSACDIPGHWEATLILRDPDNAETSSRCVIFLTFEKPAELLALVQTYVTSRQAQDAAVARKVQAEREATKVTTLSMSAAGLEKLKLASNHLAEAHALFLGLRESGDLDITGHEDRP